jgi:hypothetical protein
MRKASLEALHTTCGGIHTEKKAEKVNFYLRHNFRKMELIPRFSASQNILFYHSQKPKKNYRITRGVRTQKKPFSESKYPKRRAGACPM